MLNTPANLTTSCSFNLSKEVTQQYILNYLTKCQDVGIHQHTSQPTYSGIMGSLNLFLFRHITV